jgi:hypothetical protein
LVRSKEKIELINCGKVLMNLVKIDKKRVKEEAMENISGEVTKED